MKMKRFLSIVLAILLLGSRVGFALNVHYCGDHIAKVSLAYSPENCGMENGEKKQISNALKFSKKFCCEDDVLLFQNHEPQKHQTEFLSQEVLFTKNTLTPFETIQQLSIAEIDNFSIWNPPPESTKLFLIYHALVFYD